jgi:hypothetical protein
MTGTPTICPKIASIKKFSSIILERSKCTLVSKVRPWSTPRSAVLRSIQSINGETILKSILMGFVRFVIIGSADAEMLS